MNYGYKYGLVQTVAPLKEPVTTAEQKSHMNVTLATDDTLIDTYIKAARLYVEQITGRQLITATYRLSLDYFPVEIMLPMPPLGAITTLNYTDTAGASQTWASSNYEVNSDIEPVRIRPAWGVTWPAIREVYRAVQVTYTAGYGPAASNVPADLVTAVKTIASTLYEFREPVITGTTVTRIEEVSDMLLWPHRVLSFG